MIPLALLEIHEIGEVIRKVRKQRGLRLEDLADENISPATISNIERGVPHVNMEKTKYLLGKLDLDLDNLPHLMVNERQELEEIQFELFKVEALLDIGNTEEALNKLDHLNLDDSHAFAAVAHYLKGKSFRAKKNWKRAERHLFNAIRLANLSNQSKENNIEAASFNELSLVSFSQNNLIQSLKYTENGLEAFIDNGERPQYKHLLKRNKAICLERLGRLGEAMQIVQEEWDSLHQIDQVETILSFYWLRSDLLRRTGMLENAIQYAKEGLELARLNRKYHSMFDLWTVLGSVYMKLEHWDQAESSFDMALKLTGKFSAEEKFSTTYARLGILYMKRERWEKAYEVLQKAIEIGERENAAPRLVYAYQAMGDYYRKQSLLSEAIPYYQKMLQIADKHDYPKSKYQALFRLSQCYEKIDEQEFQQCLRNMYTVQKRVQGEEELIEEELD
ncbi:MAG: helix-turn-helix transcriptional regulator [Firmicutes bacterium]|nr:helix-turn-helix transcriptional regulator [Bacillota bacterium]